MSHSSEEAIAEAMALDGLTEKAARERVERNRAAIKATAEQMREMVLASHRRRLDSES